MKKLIVSASAVMMIVSLSLFAGGQGEKVPGTSSVLGTVPEGVELSADGRYPAETVKLGFVNYDTTAPQVLELRNYFEYLQQAFNFEIIWSESIKSAEEEFAFIETAAAAGVKGIIGYYNEGKSESVKLATSLGMYYWGGAETADTYEPSKNNPLYVGGYVGGNMHYDFGRAIAEALVKADRHKIIVMSGGKDYGVPFFVDRFNGIMDGFEEARNNGYQIEVVYEVPGWPGTEAFAAHQAAALNTDADGLAGTLTALMWIQPLQNAGKFGKIGIASIESVNPDMLGLMRAGAYVGMTSEVISAMGMSVPMLINAIEGYGDKQLNPDGTAAKVRVKHWAISSLEELEYYASIETEGGTWTFDIEDVKSVLGAFNPDLSQEVMSNLYTAVSADEIKARR